MKSNPSSLPWILGGLGGLATLASVWVAIQFPESPSPEASSQDVTKPSQRAGTGWPSAPAAAGWTKSVQSDPLAGLWERFQTAEESQTVAARLELVEALEKEARTDLHSVIDRLRTAGSVPDKLVLAEVLALHGTPDAVEAILQETARLPEPAAQATLAGALQALSDPSGVQLAISALATECPAPLQMELCRLAERAADDEAVRFLVELAHDPQTTTGTGERITEVLASIRTPASVSGLSEIVSKYPDPQLMLTAATSLAKIGTPDAVAALLGGLDHANLPESTRHSLHQALAGVSHPDSAPMLETIEADVTKSHSTRLAAQQAILSISAARAIELRD